MNKLTQKPLQLSQNTLFFVCVSFLFGCSNVQPHLEFQSFELINGHELHLLVDCWCCFLDFYRTCFFACSNFRCLFHIFSFFSKSCIVRLHVILLFVVWFSCIVRLQLSWLLLTTVFVLFGLLLFGLQ